METERPHPGHSILSELGMDTPHFSFILFPSFASFACFCSIPRDFFYVSLFCDFSKVELGKSMTAAGLSRRSKRSAEEERHSNSSRPGIFRAAGVTGKSLRLFSLHPLRIMGDRALPFGSMRRSCVSALPAPCS